MVRTRYIRRAAAWALALGCVVLFAVTEHLASLLFAFFFLWFGVLTWKQLRDPSSHPVVRRVAA
jgi:tryptophan-rich sensory protein